MQDAKKLVVKKETVAHLENNDLKDIKGGYHPSGGQTYGCPDLSLVPPVC